MIMKITTLRSLLVAITASVAISSASSIPLKSTSGFRGTTMEQSPLKVRKLIVEQQCPKRQLDFSTFTRGQYITDELLDSYHVSIRAYPKGDKGYATGGAARVFDTANPGTYDDGNPSLLSPQIACSPKVNGRELNAVQDPNCIPQGMVLIIQESDKATPDDSSTGGTIQFTFTEPVQLETVAFLDVADGNPNSVTITTADGTTYQIDAGITEFNGFNPIYANISNVVKVDAVMEGEGSVDYLTYYMASDCNVASPTDSPVATTDAPIAPTDAPVAPTHAPMAPTDVPITPTDAPVAPTQSPVSATTAAPTSSVKDTTTGGGGGFGDPHLLTWRGLRYDYMGACDLVLVHSDHFSQGAGLDIHIRTSIRHDWSYIKSAAVRIGKDVLEMETGGVYYLNGEPFAAMPAKIHGFPIKYSVAHGGRSELIVGLGGRAQIKLREFRDFVSVKINEAKSNEFGDVVGLMGSFEQGSMLSRDGINILSEPNVFAQEWQVRDHEPKLFHNMEGPQYPQQCQLPEPISEAERRRRLQSSVSYEDAVKACADWDVTEREGCIYDVMATGDLLMGEADAF